MRILVTGGAGFIGSHLVDRLLADGHDVTVIDNLSIGRVDNIAHHLDSDSFHFVCDSILNEGTLEQLIRNSKQIYHLAAVVGVKYVVEDPLAGILTNVRGTENVLELAQKYWVPALIASSWEVYGKSAAVPLSEGDDRLLGPTSVGRWSYSDSKAIDEYFAFAYAGRGLPVVILQPTIVYGPYGAYWTVYMLRKLKTERVVLVNDGDGFCNPVYIDDVINAILLAAVRDGAVGEAFLISGEGPVTWRDFFERYARMIGTAELVSMSATELLEAHQVRKRSKTRGILKETLNVLREEPAIRNRFLHTTEAVMLARVIGALVHLVPKPCRQSLKKWIVGRSKRTVRTSHSPTASEPGKPMHVMSPEVARFYVSKTRVRIDKAQRLLGYQPAFDLEAGMELTEQWARWANLL